MKGSQRLLALLGAGALAAAAVAATGVLAAGGGDKLSLTPVPTANDKRS